MSGAPEKLRWSNRQEYNPRVFQALQVQLQSGGWTARAANFLLWASFIALRMARAEINRLRALLAAMRNRGLHKASASFASLTKLSAPVRRDPHPHSILIIAETSIPQCLRYRVEQKAEMFRRQMGLETSVVSWRDTAECLKKLPTAGAVIFYRTPATAETVHLAQEARRIGAATFFEIDDLVFDVPAYRENSNLSSLPRHERDNLLRGAEMYNEMVRFVDHAIASTELIGERLAQRVKGETVVVENALDAKLLSLMQESFPRPAQAGVTIFYGSGTDTHDEDFAQAAEPLARVLAQNADVRLILAGPLRLPEILRDFEGRIIRLPPTDLETYYASLARADINLAPLEPGPFNDAKSNIKYLEAASLGVPSVCSPRAEFSRAIRDGVNGFLADTPAEWTEKISALIRDPDLRQRMGAKAKSDVLAEYHPEVKTRPQLQKVVDLAFPVSPGSPGWRDGRPELRVLVVNAHFPPEAYGGATIVTAELVEEMAAAEGVKVAVFTGTHSPEREVGSLGLYEWKNTPVYITRLPPPGTVPNDHESPAMAELFAGILRSVQPHVVHFHCVQMLSASLAEVCDEHKVPYVISLHDAWWICERQFMVTGAGRYCHQDGVDPFRCVGCTADARFTLERFRFLWRILEGAAHLLTPSSFFRDLYIKTGIDLSRITVSKNGVRAVRGIRSREAKGRSTSLTFAYVGGRARHKGYFWLAEAFREVQDTDYVLRLVDLDRHFGVQSIRRNEWGIGGHLEITDPYTQDSLDEFFAGVDVLLFPSLWKESFGLTVREALLRDIWVISTDCGGPVEDVENGVNGTIIPMGDTAALRDALREVLRNPEKFRSARNPHKARIRNFGEQAEETLSILRNIVQGAGSPIRHGRRPNRAAPQTC